MKFVKSLNESLDDIIGKNPNVIFYGEDIVDPYGGAFKVSKGLSTKYPDQVFSTPISEATIVGMAAGMSMGGLIPIVEIMFGDFIAISADQLLNHLVKYQWMYNNKVKPEATIRIAGGGRRGYGPTHSQSVEPLLATIPQLKIIVPTEYHDPGELLKSAVLNDGGIKIFSEYKLFYPRDLKTADNAPDGISVRYSDFLYPTVHLSNCNFNTAEVLIVSFGGNSILVEEILTEMLMEYELEIEAAFPGIIKPFPYVDLEDQIEKAPVVLFLEESPVSNGWSSEIVASLTEKGLTKNKKVIRIGARNLPIPASTHLEKEVLPSKQLIISKILESVNMERDD